MKCHFCNSEIKDSSMFCLICGRKVERQGLFCHECGTKNPADAKFCSNCGINLDNTLNSTSDSFSTGSVKAFVKPPVVSCTENEFIFPNSHTYPNSSSSERVPPTVTRYTPQKANVTLIALVAVIVLLIIAILFFFGNRNRTATPVPTEYTVITPKEETTPQIQPEEMNITPPPMEAETELPAEETEAVPPIEETEIVPPIEETESVTPTEDAESATQSSETSIPHASEIRPEFKEAMDAYEAFYIEYCEFFTEYSKNPTSIKLLAKYGEFLVKIKEMDDAFMKWEDSDMTDAELKYYLNVQNRVAKMLIDIAQ